MSLVYKGFRENLEVFKKCMKKNSPVTYISGGKSSLRLVHKFLNHTCLSIKFTLQY